MGADAEIRFLVGVNLSKNPALETHPNFYRQGTSWHICSAERVQSVMVRTLKKNITMDNKFAGDIRGDRNCSRNLIPEPPDGGYGWVIVCIAFLSNFIVDGISNSFGAFVNIYQQHFNETKAAVSLIGSLLIGCYLLIGKSFIYFTWKIYSYAISFTEEILPFTTTIIRTALGDKFLNHFNRNWNLY